MRGVSQVPEGSMNSALAHRPQIVTVLGSVIWLTNIQIFCLLVCLLVCLFVFRKQLFSLGVSSLKSGFRWHCEGSVSGMKVQAEGSKLQ